MADAHEFNLRPPEGEKPVYEITNPLTGAGLRIYSNGTHTGQQPPAGEMAIMINRMPSQKHAAYERGFQAGAKAAPMLRAIRA